MFWPLVVVSSAASAAMFGAVYAYWRYWPNRRHEKRVLDLKALRDLLLYHVDDLEDIMAALKSRHDADLSAAKSLSPLASPKIIHATLCWCLFYDAQPASLQISNENDR